MFCFSVGPLVRKGHKWKLISTQKHNSFDCSQNEPEEGEEERSTQKKNTVEHDDVKNVELWNKRNR